VPPDPARLPALLDRLEALHGAPRRPLPKKALDWILWENCAYLVSDERRAAAYRALAKATGLRARGILSLPRERLLELAALGGMQPERRVAKLVTIAELVQESFDGDLEAVLALPEARARRALRRFPGIGAPGADKILLFTRTHALPVLESNGLRALVRLGLAEEGRSYAMTYRSAVGALAPHAGRGPAWLIRAHQLLRRHGQVLCKNSAPLCDACPLADGCPSAS
jgi:endonuclease III